MIDKNTDPNIANAPMSKGEKLFNALNYWGIGWIANTAVSVGSTWLFKDSKFFKPKFDALVERLGKGDIKATGNWRNWLTIIGLSSGGFTLLIPMKKIEDHKLDYVKQLDEMLDGPNAESRADVKAAHDRIAQEPTQGWFSLLASRSTAIPVIIGFDKLVGKHINPWSAKSARSADKFFNKGNAAVVKEIETAALKPGAHAEIAATERTQTKLLDYTNKDLIYSFTISSLIFGFSRVFSSLGIGVVKHDAPQRAAAAPAPIPETMAPPAAALPAPETPQPRVSEIEPQGQAMGKEAALAPA